MFIEGRKISSGAVVLVQKRSDAVAVSQRAIRWMLLALAIAVALAIGLGLLVAWRLARPLRRTAAAAHALAAGRRDVIVYPEGPEEVAEVADAVNSLASGLAQSEAREREFLLSVSHDLRTPLTAISGYAESLADGLVAPERTQEVGGVLLAESQRLSRLVADLLDLARLGAQEFRIDLIDVDVVAFARTTAQVWAARCAAVGVRFYLDGPPGWLSVRTDPSRLRQALDGLFDNALRMTPAGAPIVLAVRPSMADGTALGRDRGPGRRARAHRRRPRGGVRPVGALRPLPRHPPGRHRPRPRDRARPGRPGSAARSRPATRPRAGPGSPSGCPRPADVARYER